MVHFWVGILGLGEFLSEILAHNRVAVLELFLTNQAHLFDITKIWTKKAIKTWTKNSTKNFRPKIDLFVFEQNYGFLIKFLIGSPKNELFDENFDFF